MNHLDSDLTQSNNKLVLTTLLILVIGIVLFVGWSLKAKLSSAAIAPGLIVVENKRKTIEHLEGGIAHSVLVSDGEHVVIGQPLLKIADIATQSALRRGTLHWLSKRVEYMRLLAERDNKEEFESSLEHEQFAGLRLEYITMVENQQSLFASRKQMRALELSIMSSRKAELEGRSSSFRSKLSQNSLAKVYLLEEIKMHERLLEDGYTSRIKLLELKRSQVLLDSDIIGIRAELASIEQSIVEVTRQLNAIEQKHNSEIEQLIAQVKNDLIAAEAELKIARDSYERSLITSPSDGIIQNITVHSSGQVIKAGEVLMEVVPNNDRLIVEAIVSPQDIDMVQSGQNASVRLSGLNHMTVPPVSGEVIYVDADVSESPDGASTGFKVKVSINQNSIEGLYQVDLTPGMPAEVFVLLEQKRPIDYLLEPLSNSFYKAFREQ
ncbi:HlyD family type I secretion periplasmic adaptor subunit [Vibrio maritimus]|uniref:HlyD family type I secretion periplasmic adaptor subunit n=1 Tax=Vibrio maritimus TaxID=990268 RepID=UPI001F455539|nr:HlyD family type I secretion periplasmic adaptor subunit [Vibrio maritimus]